MSRKRKEFNEELHEEEDSSTDTSDSDSSDIIPDGSESEKSSDQAPPMSPLTPRHNKRTAENISSQRSPGKGGRLASQRSSGKDRRLDSQRSSDSGLLAGPSTSGGHGHFASQRSSDKYHRFTSQRSSESLDQAPPMSPLTPRPSQRQSAEDRRLASQRQSDEDGRLASQSSTDEYDQLAGPNSSGEYDHSQRLTAAKKKSRATAEREKIIELQAQILAQTQENSRAILNLQEQQKRRDEPITRYFKIKSAEELRLLEEKLQKEEFAFTEVFKQYCPEKQNYAHSGLAKIFTDDFMDTVNLKGVKGRDSFMGTILYNTLWNAWGPSGAQHFKDKTEFDESIMAQIRASRNRQSTKKCRNKPKNKSSG